MRTILISGVTSGFGKAFLEKFYGSYNIAGFATNAEKIAKLQTEFPNALLSKGDVTNPEDVAEIVQNTISKFSTIDILINNAGFGYFANADEYEIDTVSKMVDTNVKGVMLLTRETLPHMKSQKSGLVINIASSAARISLPSSEMYAATKFAVKGYSEGLRKEVTPFGIKVATISPGMVKTNFFTKDEIDRREKLKGDKIVMLDVADIVKCAEFIITQSQHCEVRDIFLTPFDSKTIL